MSTLRAYLFAAIAVALIALAAWFHLSRVAEAKREVHAHYANVLSGIREKTAESVRQFRAAETAWRDYIDQEAKDGQLRIDQARRDAGVAGAERDQLRIDLARYRAAARTPKDPGASAAGPSTSDALDLLAELFTGADDTAGELAQAADLAHAAGLTCERAYDALIKGQGASK